MRTIAFVAALALCAPVAGQDLGAGKAGPRTVLDRDLELALARSAAPASVSGDATVLVWDGAAYVTAVEGRNGVTCVVGRSWPESLEPQCFDEEAAGSILPIELEMNRLRHEGRAEDAVQRAVAEGLRNGRFRLPLRPAMTYMMSSAQDLYDPEGRHVGPWKPHLMIYYPYLTEEAVGLSGPPSTEAAIVVDPGTPLSNLMVVVQSAVDPEPGG